MKVILFGLLFLFYGMTSAQNLGVELPYFARHDLAHEVTESDFIPLESAARQSLTADILNPEISDATLIKKTHSLLGSGFDFLLESLQTNLVNKKEKRSQILSSADFNFEVSHSIHDADIYVKNRIGHGTFDALRKQHLHAIVIGGDASQISDYIKHLFSGGQFQLQKLPCLYEKWGLSKFYVTNLMSGQKYLLWVVPPSLQYVRHYAELFSYARKAPSQYFLDLKARSDLQLAADRNASKVKRNFRIDHVAFGYNSIWEKQISAIDSNWSVLQKQKIAGLELGVQFEILTIKNKQTGLQQNLALFASDQTVWGELVSIHMKPFLSADLKSVTFLGSAGSLSAPLNPYDVSVPVEFKTAGQNIKQINAVQKIYGYQLPDFSRKVYWESKHGHTYSPIQQNSSYLRTMMSKNIGSVDVEQSLVAEAVEKFNTQNPHQIQFNAVNVITDKPVSLLLKEKTQSDLDRLDRDQKAKARTMAVQLALMSVLNVKQQMQCLSLFQ